MPPVTGWWLHFPIRHNQRAQNIRVPIPSCSSRSRHPSMAWGMQQAMAGSCCFVGTICLLTTRRAALAPSPLPFHSQLGATCIQGVLMQRASGAAVRGLASPSVWYPPCWWRRRPTALGHAGAGRFPRRPRLTIAHLGTRSHVHLAAGGGPPLPSPSNRVPAGMRSQREGVMIALLAGQCRL